ncbi:MAG: peptidylprolyl isomerase [Candidatus Stygibacter frigidus]|nr:peptidylprolyl isomerase [Candidatus Stygibacter frigidus]
MENRILAKVNGKEISLLDVENFIQRLEPQTAAQYKNEEGIKHVLNELINQELFLNDAIERKLDETEPFKQEMAKAKEFILTQLNINSVMAATKLKDDDVRNHFNEDPTKFGKKETADTSHILVESEEQCLELRDKIVSEEISFEYAAKQHSTCPSNERGGTLGSYERGQMVPEYDNVAFNLKVNEISMPVKTQFGYHLIKLNSKPPGEKPVFDKVKDKVKNDLRSKLQRETYLAKVNEMRKKFLVEML